MQGEPQNWKLQTTGMYEGPRLFKGWSDESQTDYNWAQQEYIASLQAAADFGKL